MLSTTRTRGPLLPISSTTSWYCLDDGTTLIRAPPSHSMRLVQPWMSTPLARILQKLEALSLMHLSPRRVVLPGPESTMWPRCPLDWPPAAVAAPGIGTSQKSGPEGWGRCMLDRRFLRHKVREHGQRWRLPTAIRAPGQDGVVTMNHNGAVVDRRKGTTPRQCSGHQTAALLAVGGVCGAQF